MRRSRLLIGIVMAVKPEYILMKHNARGFVGKSSSRKSGLKSHLRVKI